MPEGMAFVFPGQGSQFVGMAQDLVENSPEVRTLFETASAILEYDLAEACIHGPEEELKQTYLTQPAIFVHSCAVAMLLQGKGVQPAFVAGHSLGEYSALVAAGALPFEDALRLVKLRGEAMQRAGEREAGTMAAIIGLDAPAVESLCAEASQAGPVVAANFNAPGQIVISGSHAGIRRAMELAKEKGARKAVELVVGGAFHSPLMAHARQDLRQALNKTDFRDARIPVYANVTAEPETRASALRELLDRQLISPVRWIETIEHMIRDGAKQFVELGPGKVLSGLVKRIDRNVAIHAIGTFDGLQAFTR